MYNIRLDKADVIFSRYVRMRDGRCVRCGRKGTGPDGIFSLQCSHYFGRRSENTRYDPENADALDARCHQIWGSEDKEAYREFKVKQLGEHGFKNLRIRSETYCKKDRKLALIVVTQLLKSLIRK